MDLFGMTRKEYITAVRREQPLHELERKAKKSRRRAISTQEELDWIIRRGIDLAAEWRKELIASANKRVEE